MRGDRPPFPACISCCGKFTPHARGSTSFLLSYTIHVRVYPACAGIDLVLSLPFLSTEGLPRMRGDRPLLNSTLTSPELFTPHARGSTLPAVHQRPARCVYPACAGIDRSSIIPPPETLSLPRMRGDRPYMYPSSVKRITFTPHARGSTLGVSNHAVCLRVYPACAGIDPRSTPSMAKSVSLPRMRGDRPDTAGRGRAPHQFTPHARGSTHDEHRVAAADWVYPACAGIDPLNTKLSL